MENPKNPKILEKELTIEKPEFLYHGSKHKHIEELEPRKKSSRDSNEGELVFATPDLAVASIFMANCSHYGNGKFGDVNYCYIVEPREKFIANDRGGHIYVLPSDTFESNPTRGLGIYEWTSKQKVKPIKKIEYASALWAMLENGVQVYFIDEKTYAKIKQSHDHGLFIFQSLQSENQRRDRNVKELGNGSLVKS